MGSGGAEFVLVPIFATADSGRTLRVRFEAEGTRPSVTPPRPAPPFAQAPVDGTRSGARLGTGLGSPLGSTLGAASLALQDEADSRSMHNRIRETEIRELSRRILGGARPQEGIPQSRTPAPTALGQGTSPQPPPPVGSLLTLNAQPREACANALPRTGRVQAVSDWAIVVSDTTSPSPGFSPADFAQIAAIVDTLLIPLVHRNFGTFTDLDANGRVILFFTPEVNRLTEAGSERTVGGFFFARDLFPRAPVPNRFEACPTSNVGEILYLLVPDPAGTINGNRRAVDALRRSTPATIVHELQHLVNAARRIHILQRSASTAFEAIWLNEGLSHVAEELVFFERSGLSKRANLGLPELQAGGQRALDAVNQYHVPNLLRLRLFLGAPLSNAPTFAEDRLETRGAAQGFLRYVLDRSQGGDEVVLRSLVDGHTIGWVNLATRVGGTGALEAWLADFAVALYADDRVEGIHADHRLASWSHPTLFAGLGSPAFPISTQSLSADAPPLDLTFVAGGSAYLRFSLPAGTVGRIVVTTGGSPLPPTFRATLLRTH